VPGTTPRGYPYPLYTETADFPDNLQDLAVAVDSDVQANLVTAVNNGLNQPSVRAHSQVVQAVAVNTDVTMTFNVEDYDNANWFNSGVSQTNFTAPSTGFYLISSTLVYAADVGSLPEITSGGRGVIIKVNGVFVWNKTVGGVDYDITQNSTANLFSLTAGDIVTVVARHNSSNSASLNVTDKRISINRMSV